MNTREIAAEYRLSHWAGIMQERNESVKSVKAFCENAGIHENTYYYWQKKLREAAIEGLTETKSEARGMVAPGFMEVRLAEQLVPEPLSAGRQGQISIEVAGTRMMADSEYPIDKLSALIREVRRPC